MYHNHHDKGFLMISIQPRASCAYHISKSNLTDRCSIHAIGAVYKSHGYCVRLRSKIRLQRTCSFIVKLPSPILYTLTKKGCRNTIHRHVCVFLGLQTSVLLICNPHRKGSFTNLHMG